MSEIDAFIQKFSGLTEEYKFYNGEITLRYDPKAHIYLLLKDDGTLEVQDGVTNIVHILDKSKVLIPWACKMMAQKLITTGEQFYERVNLGEGNQAAFYDIPEEKYLVWINEAKSAHKDKLDDAGEIGHQAHAWIETWIKYLLGLVDSNHPNLNKQLDGRAVNCCQAAQHWCLRHNVRWISTERKIYSKYHKYAGTMDGLARVDSCDNPHCCPEQFKDRLTLVDWKTSNYLYVEFILQTSAYKQAYEEETLEEIEDVWVIRLGKENAEFEAWHVPYELHSRIGWFAFLTALHLKRDMDAVEQAVEEMKDIHKQLRKAEKEAQKEADLKIKCKNADRYKGKRKPVCNGGNPCETCLKKYEEEQAAKTQRLKELASVGINPEVYECAMELNENLLESMQKELDKIE